MRARFAGSGISKHGADNEGERRSPIQEPNSCLRGNKQAFGERERNSTGNSWQEFQALARRGDRGSCAENDDGKRGAAHDNRGPCLRVSRQALTSNEGETEWNGGTRARRRPEWNRTQDVREGRSGRKEEMKRGSVGREKLRQSREPRRGTQRPYTGGVQTLQSRNSSLPDIPF